MKELTAYLNFQSDCRDACNFYAKALDATPWFQTFEESKQSESKATDNLIMHARLTKNDKVLLMASDCPPGMPFVKGTNFTISIDCESEKEVDKLFAALGEKGVPVMPPAKMFWGAYFGMVTDKFGVQWMFNYDAH